MQNEYIKKLESAFKRRMLAKWVTLHNVACEACGTNILNYQGPMYGILCRGCSEINWDASYCGNQRPENFDGCRDYELDE